MTSNTLIARFHPVLASLHWLIALVILAPLTFGTLHLARTTNTEPTKIEGLRIHMAVGALVGFLMLVGLIARFGTRHPVPASAGSPLLDRLA